VWDVTLSHIPEAINPIQHCCENIMSLGRLCFVVTVVAFSVNAKNVRRFLCISDSAAYAMCCIFVI
jgi:hypothetical protein